MSLRPLLLVAGAVFLAMTFAVSGCAAGAGEPAANSVDLMAAHNGVCRALRVGADRPATITAFQDQAHDALHALAAAPTLRRSLATDLLETKARVEADIERGASLDQLRADLAGLLAAVEAALGDLGHEATACQAVP